MEMFYRIIIYVFSVAALILTAFFIAGQFRRTTADSPAPQPARRELWRIFALTAGAALLSRMVLLAFCSFFTDIDSFSSLAGIWNHWDGPHYMDIARYGYTTDQSTDQWLFIVFFPLYPFIVSLVSRLGLPMEWAGLAVSWAALMGAAFMLYRLVCLDHGPGDARRAVKYMLIFPVTVFLGAHYTESLFLLLSISCLYAMRRRRWALSGILGLLAALTRNLGALLVLPFFVEYLTDRGLLGPGWRQRWRTLRLSSLRGLLWIALIPLGTLIYLAVNQAVYGDPFMFMTIQRNHWHQQLDFFANVLYRTFNYALTDENIGTVLYLWVFQTVTMVLAIIGLPFMARRLRPSYGLYMTAYLTVSFSASMLLSAARYLMGLAVLFPALAVLTRNKWADRIVTAVFLILAFLMARGFALYRMVL